MNVTTRSKLRAAGKQNETMFRQCTLLVLLAWSGMSIVGCGGDSTGNGGQQTAGGQSGKGPNAGGTSGEITKPAPKPEAPKPFDGPVWFSDANASGIDFKHVSGHSEKRPFPAANGSGLAGLDYDLDSNIDLYFLTGQELPPRPSETTPRNHLYRNLGEWNFENVSAESGLDLSSYSAGIAVGDYNQDGFPDVYITCIGKNVFYENMGDGTFQQRTLGVGEENSFPASAAMFDYNNDGFLDIYVCNYGAWKPKQIFESPCRKGKTVYYCGPNSITPGVDMLLENDGQGGFVDVTQKAGVTEPIGRGQGVIAADMNDDGLIDAYLGNDLNANSFFMNQGDKTFRDITESSGVAYNRSGVAQAGMGVDAADVNGDGLMDLFVTNFDGDYNSLYLNSGDEFYNEQSARTGVASEGMPYVGWGVSLTDFDLDSWCDIVLVNGHIDPNREDSPYKQPALAWVNDQKGRFRFLGAEAGPHFQTAHAARAMLVGDLDNDGDHDVVIGHQDAAPVLLKNNRIDDSEPASITLRLVGVQSNRDAVGSSILVTSLGRTQRYQVKGGGSYLTARDYRLVVAAKDSANITIRWPSKIESELKDLKAGNRYVVVEPPDDAHEPQLITEYQHHE